MELRTCRDTHLTPVTLSQHAELHHELPLYSQTIFPSQPSSKIYSLTWIMTWQAVCHTFKEWASGDTWVQISQELWWTRTLHLDNKSTIWHSHLIWAFLKALDILGCRAASATLPRSVSAGIAVLMGTCGAEGGEVREQWVEETENKMLWGFKRQSHGQILLNKTTCVHTVAHSLIQSKSPHAYWPSSSCTCPLLILVFFLCIHFVSLAVRCHHATYGGGWTICI